MTGTAVVFDVGAGESCLDLINTLNGRATVDPREQLTDYEALLQLAGQAAALTPERAAALRGAALRDTTQAATLVERTRAFREALYGIFDAVINGRAVQADDMRLVNDELRQALAHLELQPVPERFRWTVGDATPQLAEPLWLFARSAFELLLSPDLSRVRECANHDCGWLFLDLSRNRSRKWCDMSSCGNRAKVRRFREREAHA